MLSRREAARTFALYGSALAFGVVPWSRASADSPATRQQIGAGHPDKPTIALLMATARTITGLAALQGPYEGYYEYQAENRPGHLIIYQAFARTVRAAMGESSTDFSALPNADRLSLLNHIRASSEGSRFEVPIFQETLGVFAKTDAWLLLGYDGWPGSARGLDEYRNPVQKRAAP